MKRFRNADGKLNVTFEELKTATAQEAASYYQIGGVYRHTGDGREYIYAEDSDGIALFQGFGGNLLIPADALGSFLPDVASNGSALIRID